MLVLTLTAYDNEIYPPLMNVTQFSNETETRIFLKFPLYPRLIKILKMAA